MLAAVSLWLIGSVGEHGTKSNATFSAISLQTPAPVEIQLGLEDWLSEIAWILAIPQSVVRDTSGDTPQEKTPERQLDNSPPWEPIWTPELPVVSGAEQWRGLVCNAPFTWDCGWALATIECESSGSPLADGHEWYQGQYWHFVGLWQIAVPIHEGNEWLYDPYLNTVEAHLKYVNGGTGHWPNCPN